ncbi:hypothetical protein MO973_13645 [Paenibacillus sp. TRM 82003]|nr:hypothetical protein [Paenibacillus sp. TRM 82003]
MPLIAHPHASALRRLVAIVVPLWIVAASVAGPLPPRATAAAAPAEPIVIVVKSSPSADLETRLTIYNGDMSRALERMSPIGIADSPHLSPSDRYVFASRRAYRLERTGALTALDSGETFLPPPSVRGKLLSYADRLRRRHYGELAAWDEAKAIVPMKSVLTLVDLESGLTFRAQRRAGRDHADVQPVGRTDTEIMKRIYNGRWSWNRRAVLVRIGDRTLAASMHGMPHGGDGIPNNGFSGHFCVHFLGSSTHRSAFADPEHQLMIHKAGGNLDAYLGSADVLSLSDAFFAAVRLKEQDALRRLFVSPTNPQIDSFLNTKDLFVKMHRRWSSEALDPGSSLAQEVPVVVWIYRDGGRKDQATFRLRWERPSPMDPWRLEQVSGWEEV